MLQMTIGIFYEVLQRSIFSSLEEESDTIMNVRETC